MMPAVDHSAMLLDPQSMGALLGREMPGLAATRVRDCRIHQTRRRISRKTEEQGAPYLGVVYELDVDASAAQTARTLWLYAKAYSCGASRAAWADACAIASVGRSAATPPVRLESLDALVWRLPADPAMPHLAQFLDAARTQSELHGALGSAHGEIRVARRGSVEIIRHEPESHCTARFHTGCDGRRRVVYGKTYADDTWVAVARRVRALQAAGEADRRAFEIARLLGASAALRAVWQEEVRGAPLRSKLGGPRAALWLQRAARALGRLQAGAPMGDARLASTALLARAEKQCRKLAWAEPRLGSPLTAVLASLQRTLPADATPVVAHGDLHIDQMLCRGTRLVLFDFDNFAEGSPAHDVADFASQLLTDTGFTPERRRELARRFIAECLGHLPRPPRMPELDWYLRVLLLRKAYSFFVRHREGWRERALDAATQAGAELAALPAFTAGPRR